MAYGSGYFKTSYQADMALVDTRLRVASLALLLLALAFLPAVATPFVLDLAAQAALAAIGALALNILTGLAGQISLGHAGFLAAGAFTTAILVEEFKTPAIVNLGAAALVGRVRRTGARALAGVGVVLAAALALAGLLLVAFPGMDHPWLDWMETAAPSLRRAFLDADEAESYADARDSIERGTAELGRLRAMQQEVQWGSREMSAEMQERLRQYLASRSEMVTGDRMVLGVLRARARQRQRWLVGLPLLVVGVAGVVAIRLRRRR